MQVVILAGGLATRLENITKNQVKSIIKVFNKPFLEYQIERLKDKGIKDIVLCISHMGEQIENYFGSGKKHNLSIRYSREDELLGTTGTNTILLGKMERERCTLMDEENVRPDAIIDKLINAVQIILKEEVIYANIR